MRALLEVHWVRHGEVASHRGDVPLTEDGLARAEETGRRLGEEFNSGEMVSFLYAPTRRAWQTAEAIHSGVAASFEGGERGGVELCMPAEEWALRNPDLYVAGVRVEMVSTPEALAEQVPGLRAKELSGHSFFKEFWARPDRVGYWVGHPDPPGEDWNAVARRLLAFASSLRYLLKERPKRYVCVTHSPLIRAFLRCHLTNQDPGEPGYLESVDLTFSTERCLTVRFRERSSTVTLDDAGDIHRPKAETGRRESAE